MNQIAEVFPDRQIVVSLVRQLYLSNNQPVVYLACTKVIETITFVQQPVSTSMSPEDKLFQIADRQQGYFTSQQAETCGIARSNFHFRVRSGEWVKSLRGIYRLARYPLADRSELVLWTLWSRDRKGNPQGVWSHETALDIHELSDIMPSKMHMTVPPRFRKQVAIPKHLKLHFANLAESDVETWQGYQVTTPLRTLIDVMEEGIVPQEQIEQAIRDGLKKGTLNFQDLNKDPHPQLKKYRDLYVRKHKV